MQEEFESKVIEVKRVTRVTEGGKQLSFRAIIVVGDKNGRVGVGVAKGKDVSIAVDKATNQAKQDMIKIPITKNFSIPYEVRTKYGSAVVFLKPAILGKGLMAGGPVRVICELAGIKNIISKIIKGKNKINIARATIKALSSF